MQIRELKKNDEKSLKELYQQLTDDPIKLDTASILKDKNIFCFVVEEENKIIGSGSLAIFRNPIRGLTGIVENVIVSKENRGRGLGKKIMDEIFLVAEQKNLEEIVLISNTNRDVAIKMYQKLGFKLIDTNFFRKEL